MHQPPTSRASLRSQLGLGVLSQHAVFLNAQETAVVLAGQAGLSPNGFFHIYLTPSSRPDFVAASSPSKLSTAQSSASIRRPIQHNHCLWAQTEWLAQAVG